MPELIFLAGSSRKASLNKKLAQNAASIADELGAKAVFIDLADYPLPLYNGDDEDSEGVPENAIKLKEMFTNADGFFIATPEYNSSLTPLLKNTLDWMSRSHEENEKPLKAYKGKVAALSGTSPGSLGALRGLVALRMMLGNIGVHVTPTQTAIAGGQNTFDDEGNLTDEKYLKMLRATVKQLVETAQKLNN